jgi:hypothetical protein
MKGMVGMVGTLGNDPSGAFKPSALQAELAPYETTYPNRYLP